jgi:hypothetical protein
MALITEELEIAEQAQEALNALSSATVDEAISTLTNAKHFATTAMTTTPLNEQAVNDSRYEVVTKFNDLIQVLQHGSFAPHKIESARRAVEDWIKELKALE